MQYRLPAEWENHNSILIMFPYNGKDFPGKLHPVRWAFVEYIKKISFSENVIILVRDEDHKLAVSQMLEESSVNMTAINLVIYNTQRTWMRDSGPITVLDENNRPVILDFKFNAWARYTYHRCDDFIPQFIAKFVDEPFVQPTYNGKRVVLEGGAIDINGCGSLICTEECLMSDTEQVRNPGFSKQDYEEVFKQYFGVTNVIWLGRGIYGDDTHGHVDDFCRFVNENTVVVCKEDNPDDVNYKSLQDNIERLKNAKLENGKPLNIVTLPMPSAVCYKNMRLPASYANFLITNKSVLVPTYNDANDRIALNILADLFPNRTVIGINAVDIVWGLGSLHCLSHEIR
ncbi:MAG: agmatine deiminase family protein [Bacteroidales bacterium]|nr:agmatine deiminase family protein [Bacteroidales bacterium]